MIALQNEACMSLDENLHMTVCKITGNYLSMQNKEFEALLIYHMSRDVYITIQLFFFLYST